MKKPSPRETGTTRAESRASPGALYRMHRFEGRGTRLARIAALATAALLSTGVRELEAPEAALDGDVRECGGSEFH
jgi:hypothetical protein